MKKIPLWRRAVLAASLFSLLLEPALAEQKYMLQVPVVGVATAPAGEISVTPSPARFGSPVAVGSEGTTLPIAVKNTGFSTIQSVVVSLPSGYSDFTQTNDCPGTLSGGAGCTVTIGFKPSTVGDRSGQLAVSSNASNGLQLVPISGNGITPSASLTLAAFAATQVGQTSTAAVTVSNASTVALNLTPGSIAAPFSVDAGTCAASLAAGTSCAYRITFAPTDTAAATAPFKVSFSIGSYSFDKTATITAAGQAATATLSAVAFGSVAAGVTKDATSTLTNTGVGPITVGAPTVSGAGFSLGSANCSSSLAVGASCSIGVHLTGSGLTAHTGTLTVPTLAGAKTAALTGQSQQAVITFEPTSYAFGTKQVGTTTSQSVTLRNSGNIPTGALSFGSPSGYSVAADSCTSGIAAGGTCSVSVSFIPGAAQSYSGSVSATSSGLSAALGLSGTGQAASATLSAVAFGNIPAGTTVSQDATLANTGVGPLTLGTPTVTGSEFAVAGGTCAATLAPGATCTVKVSLTAAGTTAHSGTLSVSTSEAGAKSSSLSGQSQQASISVSPTSRNFPDTRIGQSAVSAVHTITNGGNIAATGLAVAAPAGFSVSDSSCSTTLAAGGNCSFTITFTPTTTTPYADSVRATSANAGSATVAVSGTGTLVSVATLTSASSITLADWYQPGAVTGAVTYRNDGNTPMTLASPALSSPLSVVSNTCSSVAASASCAITVALTRNANSGGSSLQAFIPSGATTAPVAATVNWSIYSIISNWSTTSLDFGSVQVGQSATKTLTLSNLGSVAANYASNPTIVNQPAGYTFDLSACSNVVPNGSCSVSVTFAPTSTGTVAGSSLYTQASSLNNNTLSVTGVGAAQAATLSDIAFGARAAGSTTDMTSTLTNTGVGPITLNVPNASTSVTGTGFTFVSTTCSTSLAAGASCTETVRYTASGTSGASGTVNIDTSMGTKTAALSGQSQQAIVTLSQTSHAYGNVQVGSSSGTVAVTITNSGNIAANGVDGEVPAGFTLSGGAPACTVTLAAGSSCSTNVGFSPTAAQAYAGAFTVAGSNFTTASMTLSGSGVVPAGSISDIAFGSRATGTSTDLTATLTNTGVGSLSVATPTVSGGGFTYLGTTCVSPLAVGASCTLTARFAPTTNVAFSGQLSVPTGAGTKVASLTGQGQYAVVASGSALQYSDGTIAQSCKAYRNGSTGYQAATGSGIYNASLGRGTEQVYCDMTTDGGGWTMVARTNTAASQSATFGWHASLGSVSDFTGAYSLDVLDKSLDFSEILFGNASGTSNTWGAYVYKMSISRSIATASTNYAGAYGDPTPVSAGASSGFWMAQCVGFTTSSSHSYFLRDNCSDPDSYGLFSSGWYTAYGSGPNDVSGQAAGAAYGGYINGAQGMLMVR